MGEIYNSKLISKLNNTRSFAEIKETLYEMSEIKSPVFIFPIIDGYKVNIKESYSHYYLSALSNFDSKEVLEFAAKEILNSGIRSANFIYLIEILNDRNYYNDNITEVVTNFFNDCSKYILDGGDNDDFDRYDIDHVLNYFKNSKIIQNFYDYIKLMFLNPNFDEDSKILLLEYLLEINKEAIIDYLVKHHDDIKDKKEEVASIKILKNWKGPLTDEFKEKIRKNGGERAKEILIKYESDKVKVEGEKKIKDTERESNIFSNVKIVDELDKLIDKINDYSLANDKIAIKIFDSTGLQKQNRGAATEDEIMNAFSKLRVIIDNVAKGLNIDLISREEKSKIMPVDILEEDYNKPLNKLFIYLKYLDYKVDFDLFGLRDVNKVISLYGHKDKEREKLIDSIKKINVYNYYEKENWKDLHLSVLKYLYDSLNKMSEIIKIN